jgi:hypothetical protein
VNGLDDEARAIALGIADTFQEAKAKAKMAIGHTAGLVWEDLNTINNYLGDPRNGWLGMNPLGRGLQEGVGLTSALLGKIVFHGSPHKFEKFAMSKIGTGEGAQAYGHGLYFSENPAVAREYQKNLTDMRVSAAQRALASSGDDVDTAIAKVKAEIEHLRSLPNAGGDAAKRDRFIAIKEQKLTELNAFKNSGEMSKGALYHVDLPDESIAKMLDWDKPLSEQPENVRQALKPFLDDILKRADDPNPVYRTLPDAVKQIKEETLTGQQLYQWIGRGSGQELSTENLRKLGIPGIKYLDAGSRGTGGTSNFVVFDDTLPKIVGKE